MPRPRAKVLPPMVSGLPPTERSVVTLPQRVVALAGLISEKKTSGAGGTRPGVGSAGVLTVTLAAGASARPV